MENFVGIIFVWTKTYNIVKKQKECLEGSLDRVLFMAGLEFLKILVSWLPQNITNVNTECSGKPRQLNSLWLASWNIDVFILLFWS